MHDTRMLREQIEALREGMRRRGNLETTGPLIDRGEALDIERRTLIQAADERKAFRNANAQEVAKRKRAGESADDLIVGGRAIGDEIARLESELRGVEEELQRIERSDKWYTTAEVLAHLKSLENK